MPLAHRGRGVTPAALADFRRADELAPDTAGILTAWGETLRAAGRYEEAVALLDRAIGAAPGDAYATAVRGSALHRLGRHTEALADLDRAIALRRDNARANARRAEVRAESAAGTPWITPVPPAPPPPVPVRLQCCAPSRREVRREAR
ncbi:tetratricopeptide repeat protein [Streptomyces sp. NPDC006638]|uniref:tetratricopeptide repeat protein n=1 Tax=Streptomyces sp. NPDC006638 TaxID=3157183 RepID=UPI00339F0D8D